MDSINGHEGPVDGGSGGVAGAILSKTSILPWLPASPPSLRW